MSLGPLGPKSSAGSIDEKKKYPKATSAPTCAGTTGFLIAYGSVMVCSEFGYATTSQTCNFNGGQIIGYWILGHPILGQILHS